MKRIEIIKYEANDGTLFEKSEDALDRDLIHAKVQKVFGLIKPTPTELNWEGYIQHSKEDIDNIKQSMLALVKEDGSADYWFKQQKNLHNKTPEDLLHGHSSWWCRIYDDDDPISKAWQRLNLMDNACREYNQQYYVEHPEEAGGEYHDQS